MRREKLTDLFRKKEPVVPKIPGEEEHRRTHSISDPEHDSGQVCVEQLNSGRVGSITNNVRQSIFKVQAEDEV